MSILLIENKSSATHYYN